MSKAIESAIIAAVTLVTATSSLAQQAPAYRPPPAVQAPVKASPTPMPSPTPPPVYTPPPPRYVAPTVTPGQTGGVMPGVQYAPPSRSHSITVSGPEIRPQMPQQPVAPAIGVGVSVPANPAQAGPDRSRPAIDTQPQRP